MRRPYIIFRLRHPLSTHHHNYQDGRPRPGRRFDWSVAKHECGGNTDHWGYNIWFYSRQPDGQVHGRYIEFGLMVSIRKSVGN